MLLLFESIRIENGKILNVSFHNERMTRSLYNIYGLLRNPELEKIIEVPETAAKGIYKCRVLYDDKTTDIEFIPHSFIQVRSLKIIFSDEICYPNKYINRDKINRLLDKKGECDDILIVKFGKITGSSYANIILRNDAGRWVTPASFLLPGTRRANLLKSGLIEEADVSFSDISEYAELKLINAMQGLDDTEGIPVRNIITGT